MSEKTWTLKVNEQELKALIEMHCNFMLNSPNIYDVNPERSARIHDLTKRLAKKDELEVSKEMNDEPQTTTQQETKSNGW